MASKMIAPNVAVSMDPRLKHPTPDKGPDDPYESGDYHAPGVGARHDPLRQDTGNQPDHYPDYDGPDAYGSHLPRLHRAPVYQTAS